MRNNAGQRPPPLQACGVVGVCKGSCGFTAQLLRSTLSLIRYVCFSCVQRLHSLPSLPLCGKYEVSIIVPLLFWCDCAWWLPLTGLSWLPYTLSSCACGSTIQAPNPHSSIVNEFKLKTNKPHTWSLSSAKEDSASWKGTKINLSSG